MRRQHPRCGTSFLMVVMLVAIVLFSVINFEAIWMNLVVRIALMPLVAGLSYEVIRYAAKKESSAIFKFMTMPGPLAAKYHDPGTRQRTVGSRDQGSRRIIKTRANGFEHNRSFSVNWK